MAELNPKQEIFVKEYLMSFNATKSAIKAGYSERTAYSQGQRLLNNVEVKKKIDYEMKRLRERFADDSNKAYAKLWEQLDAVDKKIAEHDEAMESIDNLEREINELVPQIAVINKRIGELKTERADAGKRKNEALIMKIDEQLKEAYEEMEPLNASRSEKNREIDRLSKYLIKPAAWEKIMSMRMNILHDILDRGGYKSTDKVELSGTVNNKVDMSALSIEELRKLAELD